jgi:hypothetical protein
MIATAPASLKHLWLPLPLAPRCSGSQVWCVFITLGACLRTVTCRMARTLSCTSRASCASFKTASFCTDACRRSVCTCCSRVCTRATTTTVRSLSLGDIGSMRFVLLLVLLLLLLLLKVMSYCYCCHASPRHPLTCVWSSLTRHLARESPQDHQVNRK